MDVRVVLDGRRPSDSVVLALNEGLSSERVTLCLHRRSSGSACIGDKINHNKFFLFSELTDGSVNVVVQSSANLNLGQVSRHNNMVIARGNDDMYGFYLDYWDDLQAAGLDPAYFHSHRSGPLKAYFFPRASGDTILNIIGNIHCDPGTSHRTRVRVAMAFFADGRVEVARALAEKKRQGCSVRVIIGSYDRSPGAQVASVLRAAGVPLIVTNGASPNVHSKYMLIEGRYASGTAVDQLVFTGSHNYNRSALRRNDEVLLRVADSDVFDAFLRNWRTIRDQNR